MVLFNRVKSCTVTENEDVLEVRALFIDSHHEISLTLLVVPGELEIIKAKAEMIRTPHPDCKQAAIQAEKLCGIKIGSGAIKAVQQAVGHSEGCTHLTDLAIDAIKGVVQANFQLQRRDLSREDRHAKYSEQLAGTCYFWSRHAEKS